MCEGVGGGESTGPRPSHVAAAWPDGHASTSRWQKSKGLVIALPSPSVRGRALGRPVLQRDRETAVAWGPLNSGERSSDFKWKSRRHRARSTLKVHSKGLLCRRQVLGEVS
ncbi:hypothetical protein AAFF_G00058320 [Aldrovandia affinis]|uniref:Uncharacterized protein n=1 Tax=Aldrovandia affinis TaxID=143900 RepID=A0AAD7WEA1_9TELE|nr:hypothetical protein AAFF_G00058320 [Aldrovandia affinis]